MKKEKLMQKIQQSKNNYDSIEIPEKLNDVVEHAVYTAKASTVKKGEKNMKKQKNYWQAATAAAMVLICFTIGLNTSQAFAAAVENVPVLGAVSRVLTFRNYEKSDEDKTIHIEIPKIEEEGGNAAAKDMTAKINAEIEKVMSQYEADAEKRIEEYKQAFISTGGTEEEFAEKGIKVDAGYEVFYESEDILSLVITANENWSNAYGLQYYYNLNLETGTKVTLKELLGDDYVEKANASIREQMKERTEKDNVAYWDGSNGVEGFKTIDDSTNFYINKDGNPVIVFDKYEIAAGAYGRQEFEIVRE